MAATLNALISAPRVALGVPSCEVGAPAAAPAWPSVPLKPPADPGRPCPLPAAALPAWMSEAATGALLPAPGAGGAAGQATAPRSAASCKVQFDALA